MMRGAYALDLAVSYQPSLALTHHIHAARLTFMYLVRLMWGHGRTRFVLDRIAASTGARKSSAARSRLSALSLLFRSTVGDINKSVRYACCMLAFRLGYRWELIVPDLSMDGLGAIPERADQESEG